MRPRPCLERQHIQRVQGRSRFSFFETKDFEEIINGLLPTAIPLPANFGSAFFLGRSARSHFKNPLFFFAKEQTRNSRNNADGEDLANGKIRTRSSFREAPEFRNGAECSKDQIAWTRNSCDTSSVHIAMTLDSHYLRGSVAAVLSILRHASCPKSVFFHFLIAEQDFEPLQVIVRSTFPYLRFNAYSFAEKRVKNLISDSIREALENPLNYARTYLADILPDCVKRIIYLDSDLIVLDDISKLWHIELDSRPIGAPEYCHANLSKYFTGSFWADRQLSKTFEGRKPCYFNTGVMVIDLEKWRKNDYRERIENWMSVQRENRIYELGSLPPFLLVFAGELKAVEHKWNQHGLGGDNFQGSCRSLHSGEVSLLHWSGKGKPWLRLDSSRPCPMDALWAHYDLYISQH